MAVSVADNRIRSVISFDRGGTWRRLNKPENVDCDQQVQKVRSGNTRAVSFHPAKSVTPVFPQCDLHIHGEHSRNNRMVPMVTLSESTAVGLVVAHGNGRSSRRSLRRPPVVWSLSRRRASPPLRRHRGRFAVVLTAPRRVRVHGRRLQLEGHAPGPSPLQHPGLGRARRGRGGSPRRTSQDHQVPN